MKKILVVEDEIDIRESLTDLLEMNGFAVSSASNGAEAIFVANANKPDLILSDLMMPGINGLELLKIIQNKNDLLDVPFVFLSANVDINSIRNGMNLGADDYLTKPVKKDELLQVIHRRLDKAEAIKKQVENDYKEIVNQLNSAAHHEFHTPLHAILGFAQIIKNSPYLSQEKILSFVEMIEASGNRLKNILDNILLYRAFSTNTYDSVSERFLLKMDELKTEVRKIAKQHERENDIIISNLMDSYVQGNKSDFFKIIREIIDNAFKFSANGEPVILDSFFLQKQLMIIIRDFGNGMTKEQISRMDAFVQFDRHIYEQQGLGLGLYVSKKLAQQNDWTLELVMRDKGMECKLLVGEA